MTRFTSQKLGTDADRTLVRYLNGAVTVEVQPLRGRGREVELTPAHVGTAVDHRHAHDATAMAQRDLRAAGQRLVRDAEPARGQRAATAQPVPVQARPVPGRVRRPVHVQAPQLAREPVAETDARGSAQRAPDAFAQHVAAGAVGAIAVQRDPARVALDLQRGGRWAGGADATGYGHAASGLHVHSLRAHAHLRGMSGYLGVGRSGRRRCRREAQRAGNGRTAQRGSRHPILLWCNRSLLPAVTATSARVLPARLKRLRPPARGYSLRPRLGLTELSSERG